MSFQTCVIFCVILWRKLGFKQHAELIFIEWAVDFLIYVFMCVCVPQKKESHTGLEQHEGG